MGVPLAKGVRVGNQNARSTVVSKPLHLAGNVSIRIAGR